MKTSHIGFIMIFLLLYSCTPQKTAEENGDYVFKKNKALALLQSKMRTYLDIPLEVTHSSLLPANASMCMDGENLFVFANSSVMRFNYNGILLNTIGKIGHSANEYIELNDVTLCTEKKHVEILSPNLIHIYNYDGELVARKSLDIPARSFIRHGDIYWFSTGHNTLYSKYALFKTDNDLNPIDKYIEGEYGIPFSEANFGKGTILTFRESMTHDIYMIDERNNFSKSYKLHFVGLEIPADLFIGNPMEIMKKMNSNDYAVISCFLENQQYIYMQIEEYISGDEPKRYHWIINKQTNKDVIIALNNVPVDSFHFNPQILDDKNILFFLGFPIINNEQEYDLGSNPHVIGVNLEEVI